MKTILLVILSVLFLTSCGNNTYNIDTIVEDVINEHNSSSVSYNMGDTLDLVSIDSSFTVKDLPYFNHTEKDTSKIVIKGHKDGLVIIITVKQYESGYYIKSTAMILYDDINKTSHFLAITSDKNMITKSIKELNKSDKVKLQEFKSNHWISFVQPIKEIQ